MNIENERKLFEEWVAKNIASGKNQTWQDWCFDAWQASANRKGYKLVPVEPTKEMINAGVDESDVDWKRLKFAYQAMIGAVE